MSAPHTYHPTNPLLQTPPLPPLGRRWSRPVLFVALVLGAILGAIFGILIADARDLALTGVHVTTAEGLMGGLMGLLVGVLFVALGLLLFRFISDAVTGAIMLGLFAMLVMALFGGLFGAIIGLISGAMLGALVGMVKSNGGLVIGSAPLPPQRRVLPPLISPTVGVPQRNQERTAKN